MTMRIFEMEQGGGKTTTLVKLMFEPGNEDVVYVAPSRRQANNAMEIARSLGHAPLHRRFISMREFDDLLIFERKALRVILDEAEWIIRSSLGVGAVVAIAGTDGKRRQEQIEARRREH